jgi:hypothetical protein
MENVGAYATQDTDVRFQQIVEQIHQGFLKTRVWLPLGGWLISALNP